MKPLAALAPGRAALGVWDGHDAGAALVIDGAVVAAVSEERLSRVKRQGGWPHRAVRAVLSLADVEPAQVARVGVAGLWGRSPARWLDRRYAEVPPHTIDPLSPASQLFAAYQARLARIPGARTLEGAAGARALRTRLTEHGLGAAHLSVFDHHLCHAAGAAALLEGPGLVLTSDGYGDGISTGLWSCDPRGTLTRLHAWGVDASPALLYGALTRVLGHREGEEGKLTGLAGLRRADRGGGPDLGPWLRCEAGDLRVQRRPALRALRLAHRAGVDAAVLARALQRPMEEAVVALVRHHLARHWHQGPRLAVAGGLFANVSLNGRLADLDLEALAVLPAMGDQGLCLGAALLASGLAPGAARLPAMDLGPDIGGGEADPAQVAARLSAGEVVGVARGRLEMGPRALGKRSVLFDAGRAGLAERVGRALGREPFMPFAPLMRVERWSDAFHHPLDPLRRAAGEMTLALRVRPAFARAIPAAMHEDGTARPQVVTASTDAWLHEVLARFEAASGSPALVNTSFNLHREPIVCTAEEARTSAREAGLDAWILGPRLEEGVRRDVGMAGPPARLSR